MTASRDEALAGCADEPIRIPGCIQPHGVLLAFTEPDLRLAMASDNVTDLLGPLAARSLLGRGVGEVLPDGARLLRDAAGDDLADVKPMTLALDGRPVDVVLHRSDGLLVAELEPNGAVPDGSGPDAEGPWYRTLPAALKDLHDADTLEDFTTVLAREVRALTGFDRVMVYRFDPECNGEVVAEVRDPALEPFVGLRYPASDIPAQARALYAAQWLRLIPDVRYRPSPLVPQLNPLTNAPLDLSAAMLRSVSPVHCEYLQNMGVTASMSISLIDRGRLWGLIACHHYSGLHRPAFRVRIAAEFLGRTASLLVTTKQRRGEYERMLAVRCAQTRLTEILAQTPDLVLDALTIRSTTVADLLPCSGVAMQIGGRLRTLGQVPAAADLARLWAALRPGLLRGPVVTSSVRAQYPELAGLAGVVSGVLAVPLSGGAAGDALVWLRPEVLREVTWGGNPYGGEVVRDDAGEPRLSPRRSFAQWRETHRFTAEPWLPHEVEAATELARFVSDVLFRRLVAHNRVVAALQRTVLLESLPALPGLSVATRYLPSRRDVTGGDWYDLVPLPSGRIAFALGDVAGHGLSVTAISAQLRHGLRAYLLRDAGPADGLRHLNEMMRTLLPSQLATAVVAVIDPASGELWLANAGHPPALYLGAQRPHYVEHQRGPALGAHPDPTYLEDRLILQPEEGLLFYSDGLVERRDVSPDKGLAVLLREVTTFPGADLELLCERLVASSPTTPGLAGGQADLATDDVTILALRRH